MSSDDEDTAVTDVGRAIPVQASVDDCLVVVYQRDLAVGRCIKLDGSPSRIGRDVDNEVVLDDEGVSRRHAQVERRGARRVLMDVGSTNGTLLNDEELTAPAELSTGDRIKIGSTVFKYFSGSDPDAVLHEQIYRNAITDEQTELRNRRYFSEEFAREFSRALRHHRPLSLLMIDIDHFKLVNDNFGHHFGDITLKAVADIIRTSARASDLTARYGGEEIVVLLPETPLSNARTFAERLRLAIAQRVVRYREVSTTVTVSIGCAERIDTDQATHELFERADRQTYSAKAAGRNCVRG